MIEKKTSKIRQFGKGHDGLHLSRTVYDEIIKDMAMHGGKHQAGEKWQMTALFKESPEKQDNPDFEDMLSPWVGEKAKQPVSREMFENYLDFLKLHDHLNLLSFYFPNLEYLEDSGLLVCDLGTIMDINLIASHLQSWDGEKLYVLEVGGGYGRLAEAMLGVFEDQVKYVMVDAVPASLYYSYQYLKENFPHRRVGFYYSDDAADPSMYDCFIVPAWHFERVNKLKYDLCINIASMQEMEDEKVSYYLGLIDQATNPNALIYISNSRDYVYEREYNYPNNWQCIFKQNTPRSWSPYYPVEVFFRTDHDCSKDNAILESQYLKELYTVCKKRYKKKEKEMRSEIMSLRYKARKYDELITELPDLRFKARKWEALLKKLPGFGLNKLTKR